MANFNNISKHCFLVAIFLILVAKGSNAQYLFQKQFTYSDYTTFTSGIVLNTNQIYLFGNSLNNTATYRSNEFIKIDAVGDVLNARKFAFNDSSTMLDIKGVCNFDNTISVAGHTSAFIADIGFIKMDTSGTVLNSFKITLPLDDNFSRIIATKDSGNLITGYINSPMNDGPAKGTAIKTDRFGNVEWMRQYGYNGRTAIVDAIQKQNGNYLLFGNTTDFSDTIDYYNCDLVILETDPLGEIIQSQIFQTSAPDVAYKIMESGNGGYFLAIMTGAFNAIQKQELVLMETDSIFNTIWANRYIGFSTGVGNNYFGYVIKTFEGGILFSDGFRAINTDSVGTILWQKFIYYPNLFSYFDAFEYFGQSYFFLGTSAVSISSLPRSGFLVQTDTLGSTICNQNNIANIFANSVSINFQTHFYADSILQPVVYAGAFSDTISIIENIVCSGYVSDQILDESDEFIHIFPTIVDDVISVSFSKNETGRVSLYNVNGQKVVSDLEFSNSRNLNMDTDLIYTGLYFLVINTSQSISSFKFVKK
ncbi:MAG: T9SS type A sorting domain-containing protein [Bacteroidetes bacterium]|nr:T9SS type A sorting domain-containing protein [Bacteroidota bacterium]